MNPLASEHDGMSDHRAFLVPYDFSGHAEAALFAATDLARRLHADLHLLHVIEPPFRAYGSMGAVVAPNPIDIAAIHEQAMTALQSVAEGIRDFPGKIAPHVIESAGIANAICDSAESLGADLIVMGTHGRTGLAHVFIGSVAERTLRSAPCPVLTLRSPQEAEPD